MADRPGVMVFFSDWEALLDLDDAMLARLFRATVKYARYGEVPDFSGIERILWGILAPKLDNDEARYQESCRRKRYGRYKGVEYQHGRVPLEYEDWCEIIDSSRQVSTDVDTCRDKRPIATSTSTSIPTALSASTATAAALGSSEKAVELSWEEKREQAISMLNRVRSR